MTIDEAIRRCEEVAECNEIAGLESKARRQCCNDHRQLVEWLTELKELREENKFLISEFDRLINGELLKKSEQIAKYKRLLKAATGIIKDVDCNEDYLCDECEYRAKCDGGFSFYWHYADEALKLIGGDT